MTQGQQQRKFDGYFRTHAFKAYGGLLWLRFLVATGDVDGEAVTAVNEHSALRTQDRRGTEATNVPDSTLGHIFLSREARASTPVAPDFVPIKRRRENAQWKLSKLRLDDDVARKAAEEELAEAERRQASPSVGL